MIPLPLLVLPALLLLLVLLLLRRAASRRHALPIGTVVYGDAEGKAQPLRSPLRPLSGKPDYVLRTRRGAYIPVEYKSYRSGEHPPHADLMQVGAYLLLLEDLHGTAPPFGILRYTDHTLRVPFSKALRKEVLRILQALEQEDGTPSEPTPHPSLCRPCPFAPICDAARR